VLAASDASEVAQTSHTRAVTDLQFSRDNRYLAVASDDGSAHVFVARDGSGMRRVSPQGGVLGFAFSHDSRLLATIGLSTVVHLWDVATARELARVADEGMPSTVRFGPRGNTLVVSSAAGTARLLTIEDEGTLHHGERLLAAALNQAGRLAAVQRTPDTVVISSVDGGQAPRHVSVDEPFDTLAINDDGALLITQNTLTGKLAAWNVANGDRLWQITRPSIGRDSMREVEPSPDGRLLALRSWDAPDADVIDAATGRTLARASHDEAVGTTTFSPDGRLLATTGDTTVKVWSTTNGGMLHRLDLQAASLRAAFSPDGKLVATAGADRMARLWDVATGGEVKRFVHREPVFGIAFSRQGSFLATSAPDGVRLWDVATTTEVRFLEHDGGVDFLTFSPDDAYLATGSRDHSARVWHVATGREMARMTDLGEAFQVMFDAKGRFLLVQHNDASTEFWRSWLWRAEDLIAEVCSRLGRSLSTAEWQRFIGNETYRATCPALPAVP
jgi:WD40 repeat protein